MGRAPDSNASMYAPRRRAPLGRRLRVPDGAQVMHAAKDPNTPWPAITASAQVLSKRKMDRKVKRAPVEGWQNDAWAMRAETGELRFIGDRQANACSQARLYVGKKETPSSDVVPVDDGSIPAQLSAALFANAGMVEQTLRRAAQHLIFNGESNLLIREDENGQLTWDAHSITEITGSPGRWKLNNGVDKPRDIGDDEILIRAWRADPEYSARADAPVRAILSTARELRAMSMYVSAQMESRLAGSGLLLIPDGLESMHSQGGDDDDDFDLADELTDYLVETVKDRDLASSIVPFMLTGNPDLIEKVRHMTFSTELDQQVPDLRDESIRRIGLGMDSDPSVLLGQASSNHWCVDDQTEIYTQDRGWVRESELAVGDIVMTLNHDTGMSEWQPVLDIYRADVVDEPMRYMETQRHNSLTTANHRWPVLVPTYENGRKAGYRTDWTTSDEMVSKHTVITGAPHAGLPTEPKWQDDVVEAVAWYWTEGNLNSNGYGGATIAQSHTVNSARVDRIRGCLTRLFGPAGNGWSEYIQANDSSHGGPITVFRLRKDAATVITEHAPGHDKIVRTEFVESLTLAQLELFIDISCQGDGWHYRHDKIDIWQKNPAALDAFERALILSGRAVSTHESGDGVAVTALKSNRQRPAKGRNGDRERVIEEYTGVVWCPTTSNSTWFARRNGQSFFTGNSAWAVDENEIKFGVQPIVAIICHALTVGLLRPLLVEQGVSDPDLYSVWYDTTPLLVRPDRSKDAQALYDKGVISDAVLRRENGFDDTDAPSDEERTRAIIRELLSTRSDLIDKWLPALGIVVPGVTDNPVRVDDTLSDAVLEQQQDNSTPPAPDAAPAVAPEADNGPPVPGETEASQ